MAVPRRALDGHHIRLQQRHGQKAAGPEPTAFGSNLLLFHTIANSHMNRRSIFISLVTGVDLQDANEQLIAIVLHCTYLSSYSISPVSVG